MRAEFSVQDLTVGGAPESGLGGDQHDVDSLNTIEFSSAWTPPADAGHACVIVRIPLYQLPADPAVVEQTELNNMARSNYDRYISATGSPATREITTVTIGNPYPRTTRVFLVPNQTNPLYRTYLEHVAVTLEPGETHKVKVMFEYDPNVALRVPIAIGDKTIDDSNRGEAEVLVRQYSPVPNHVRVAGLIEDPDDPHKHSKELGGAEMEIVTGRKTEFVRFVYDEPSVSGSVVTKDDKQRVSAGSVIVVVEMERDGRRSEAYRTAAVQDWGFSVNLGDLVHGVVALQCYYVPGPGYADCYSGRLEMS